MRLVTLTSIDKSISASCSLFNGEKETLYPQFPFLVNSDQIFVVQIIEKIAAFVWMLLGVLGEKDLTVLRLTSSDQQIR